MDQLDIRLAAERKRLIARVEKHCMEYQQQLLNLIEEKYPSTHLAQQQLQLPLGQNQSDIQELWLKGSE